MTDSEIDAILIRLGCAPDRMLTRQGNSELLALLGVELSPRTAAKNAALRRDGPPYRIIARRALYSPRDTVRWVFGRPLRTSSFGHARESVSVAA
jgi:hypothetical protein